MRNPFKAIKSYFERKKYARISAQADATWRAHKQVIRRRWGRRTEAHADVVSWPPPDSPPEFGTSTRAQPRVGTADLTLLRDVARLLYGKVNPSRTMLGARVTVKYADGEEDILYIDRPCRIVTETLAGSTSVHFEEPITQYDQPLSQVPSNVMFSLTHHTPGLTQEMQEPEKEPE